MQILIDQHSQPIGIAKNNYEEYYLCGYQVLHLQALDHVHDFVGFEGKHCEKQIARLFTGKNTSFVRFFVA
ncbi:unnamed protein product [Amoebophrya sp. A25]|nr:unnamed protein product [Amoebophrya sp. A25]|eukprot:GSA25T00011303001.1